VAATVPELTLPLAAHVDGIGLERLPEAVIAKAKLCVLDALGSALAGASHDAIASLVAAVRPQPLGRGLAGASVWGFGLRTGAPMAALVNASMTHAVNADDAHKESMGHPGTVVIPAAIAVGEMLGAPGAAVLEATVAGYECLLRVGIGVGVASHRERGWYATGTLGPFGAAAAAAKLLKLGRDGIAGAIGLAGAQASGLWAFTADGSLANIVYPGRAAESGVLAALLVRNGLSGPRRVLEAPDGGFLRAMSDASAPDLVLADLGRRFMILDVSLKPYPCSRTTHAPIDACLAIRARLAAEAGWLERLRRITVRTYAVAKRQADIPEPTTEWMATLSIPYTVAVALVEGRVEVEHFTRRFMDSPRIRAVMRKVEVVVDDGISAAFPGKWSCRVEVDGENGERTAQGVEAARGDPRNPMAPDEVRAKFHALTGGLVTREARERISDVVEHLDREPDVARLAAMLRAARRGSANRRRERVRR
jgi:2-methylcitrate dehydratase PrpD